MARTAQDLAHAAVQLVTRVRDHAIAARAKRKQIVLRVISEAEQRRITEMRAKALKTFTKV